MAAPPGELPGWIWSFDCAEGCNHAIPGFELGLFYGVSDSTRAYYVGGGFMAPVTPYVEAYRQFVSTTRRSGVGARAGISLAGWDEYRIFYRHSIGANVAANTHFLAATGHSPNGENSATFLALVQSVGFVGSETWIPAISIGITRTTRTRYNERDAAFGVLAVASFGVSLQREQR